MIDKKKIEDLLDRTGIYMMKEYGLDVLHVLEKIMCSPLTQDIYDGKKDIQDITPESLGNYYMGIAWKFVSFFLK